MTSNDPRRALSFALAVTLLAGALAGCNTDGTGAPQAQAAPKPMTRTRRQRNAGWRPSTAARTVPR